MIGQGSLQAWMRAGFKELAQALPAFPDSIRPVEEPGLVGNLTSQEVYGQKTEMQVTKGPEIEVQGPPTPPAEKQPEVEMER